MQPAAEQSQPISWWYQWYSYHQGKGVYLTAPVRLVLPTRPIYAVFYVPMALNQNLNLNRLGIHKIDTNYKVDLVIRLRGVPCTSRIVPSHAPACHLFPNRIVQISNLSLVCTMLALLDIWWSDPANWGRNINAVIDSRVGSEFSSLPSSTKAAMILHHQPNIDWRISGAYELSLD